MITGEAINDREGRFTGGRVRNTEGRGVREGDGGMGGGRDGRRAG